MKVRGRQNYPDSKSIAGTVLPVKYLKGTFSLKRFLSRDNGQETFVTDPSVFQKSFSSSFSKRNFNFCTRQMSVRGKKNTNFLGSRRFRSRERVERGDSGPKRFRCKQGFESAIGDRLTFGRHRDRDGGAWEGRQTWKSASAKKGALKVLRSITNTLRPARFSNVKYF